MSISTHPAAPPAFALINPPGLYDPSPNGYSHVARVERGARLVYCAGQGGENMQGELSADFREQVRQAFDNAAVALAAAQASLHDVIKLTVLIVDHDRARLAILAQEVKRVWGDEPSPACTLIPVPRLALDGMLFEVEVIAAVND